MWWFGNILRFCLHFLQLGCAIACLIFYASKYDGVTKDYRWKFAIATCAFSITGTIIQSLCRTRFNPALAARSEQCSFILLIFWIGVLGTFATSFIHRDATGNTGIRMMHIAIYVDAANIVIWFLTIIDMYIVGQVADERQVLLTPNTLQIDRTTSSIPFVPHGWDAADIEAQTLAVQSPNPLLNPATEMSIVHPSIPCSTLLEVPPRAVTTENGRNVTSFRNRGPSERLLRDLSSLMETFNSSTRSSSNNNYWPWPFEWDEPLRECPVCMEEFPCWTGFPFRVAKACANHEQEFCRNCIDRSIMAELDSNISGSIHCTECRAVLDYEEVKALASPTTFVRYERMGIRGFLNDNPNFVWCQNRNCPSGQEHIGGVDQPIVTCEACGFKTCFKHQIPWHEEMLCDEYDKSIQLSSDERQVRAQQNLASIKAIHSITKPCANKDCKSPIQKTTGCDHMTCWRCKHEFCWICGTDWKSSDHRLGCGFG